MDGTVHIHRKPSQTLLHWCLDENDGILCIRQEHTAAPDCSVLVRGSVTVHLHYTHKFSSSSSSSDVSASPKNALSQGESNALECEAQYSLPLLKSLVQKAVRLGKGETAVRACAQMMLQGQEGLSELLRRLPIIMIEDVCIMPTFSILVFYMVLVSKHLKLSPYALQSILHIVYSMATTMFVDMKLIATKAMCQGCEPEPASFCDAAVQHRTSWSTQKQNIILACGLRLAYGGRDQQLLQGTALNLSAIGKSFLWRPSTFTHIVDESSCPKAWSSGLSSTIVGNPHLLLTAVDFHCSDVISHLQQQPELSFRGTPPSRYCLQDLIWQHRSCANVRACLARQSLTSTVRTPLLSSARQPPLWWYACAKIMDQYAQDEWVRTTSIKQCAEVPPVHQKTQNHKYSDSPGSNDVKEIIVIE
jgi:hypothetical protein